MRRREREVGWVVDEAVVFVPACVRGVERDRGEG